MRLEGDDVDALCVHLVEAISSCHVATTPSAPVDIRGRGVRITFRSRRSSHPLFMVKTELRGAVSCSNHGRSNPC